LTYQSSLRLDVPVAGAGKRIPALILSQGVTRSGAELTIDRARIKTFALQFPLYAPCILRVGQGKEAYWSNRGRRRCKRD
jgi:hypothetical protein